MKRCNRVISISASVGKGGMNFPIDVKRIQEALNVSDLVTGKLVVDGKYGPKTFSAILQYQAGIFSHIDSCDGRIDPYGETLQALNNPRTAKGKKPVAIGMVAVLSDKLGGCEGIPPVEKLVVDPRIKAMLEVLAFSEGTGSNYGKVVNGRVLESPFFPELVGKFNVSITDLSRHPEILVTVNSVIKSTAAGRYQFLKTTWDELKMPDFTSNSQDLAAVKLMRRRGMIEPLLAGKIDEAIYKGAPEWASLPKPDNTSFYNSQLAKPLDKVRKVYKEALEVFLMKDLI